jgi:hypothetical protein
MRGELEGLERRRVVRHLIRGCDYCREITRRLWAFGTVQQALPHPRGGAERSRASVAGPPGEVALIQQRHEMLRAGLGSEAARLSFELALLYRQQDRAEDLAALAGDVVPILSTGEMSRTVAAALLVFRRLAETNSASSEFLREAVRLASPEAASTGRNAGGTSG